MRIPWTARALSATALLLTPAEARADDVALAWNAPAECPTGDAVTAEIRRTLGGDAARRATARADVTKLGPERWQVRLVTDVEGARGERTVDADSCASIATATALIVAWAVDPVRARAAHPADEPALPAPPTPPEPSEAPGPTRASNPIGAVVAVSAAGDVGLLPSAGGAIEVAVGVLVGPVRLELAGADWFAQDATDTAGEGTRIHLLEGALRGCLRGRLGARLELDPCLGAGLVYATSDGFGETTPFGGQSSTWGALHALGLAAYRLAGPVAIRASLGGSVPTARPPFVVIVRSGGERVLHRAAPVSAGASLGVEVHFP